MMTKANRFFISRAAPDSELAIKLAEAIRDFGGSTILQDDDFGNKNFLFAMHEALREVQAGRCRVIALMSKAYLESDFCIVEAQSALSGDPNNLKERLIPVRIDACVPDGLFSNIAYLDLFHLAQTSIHDSLDVLLSHIGLLESGSVAPERIVRPHKKVMHSRFLSAHNLKERSSVCKSIRAKFERLRNSPAELPRVAIKGMPGAGKSSLAIIFAEKYKNQYAGAWWIDASQPDSLCSDLAYFGEHFVANLDEIEGVKEKAITTLRTIAEMDSAEPWLLVYDNVANPEILKDFLPSKNADVLLTTRRSEFGLSFEVFDAGLFGVDEAALFLREQSRCSESEASYELAEKLGYLPLALAQAATYCRETPSFSLSDYIDHIDKLIDTKPQETADATHYPISVKAAIKLNLIAAMNHNERVRHLIAMIVCLSPAEVPFYFFDVNEHDDEELSLAGAQLHHRVSGRQLREAARILIDYSIIQITRSVYRYGAEDEGVVVHRLVRLVAFELLSRDELMHAATQVHAQLAALLGQDSHRALLAGQHTWIFRHAMHVTCSDTLYNKATSTLLLRMADAVFSFRGNSIEDTKLYENLYVKAVATAKKNNLKQPDHVALCIVSFCYALWASSQAARNNLNFGIWHALAEIRPYLSDALALSKRFSTAQKLARRGMLTKLQGLLADHHFDKDALYLSKCLVEINRQTEVDDETLARSLTTLADSMARVSSQTCKQQLKIYNEAYELFCRVAAKAGVNSSRSLRAKDELSTIAQRQAFVYDSLKKDAKAEEKYLEAIELCDGDLFRRAVNLLNFAFHLQGRSKLEEAISLAADVHQMWSWGDVPEYFEFQALMIDLNCLTLLDRLPEAEQAAAQIQGIVDRGSGFNLQLDQSSVELFYFYRWRLEGAQLVARGEFFKWLYPLIFNKRVFRNKLRLHRWLERCKSMKQG